MATTITQATPEGAHDGAIVPVFTVPVFTVPVFTVPVFTVPVFTVPVFTVPVFTVPVFRDVKHTERKDRTQEATSFEERVEEVLQNGGFLSRPRTVRAAKAGVDVYEFQRLSRDGGPLAGAEATCPPIYTLTAWGTLALSCTCPQAKRTRVVCKHQAALTRSLLGRIARDLVGGGDE